VIITQISIFETYFAVSYVEISGNMSLGDII